MIYSVVIFILLFLVIRYDINSKKLYRDECYILMLILFVFIAGFRYRLGVDTTRYLTYFYYYTPKLNELTLEDLEFGKDPLFILLNSFVFTIGGKFYIVQLLNAAFINILIFKYIKKHTDVIFISIFIYFIWKYTVINMEEMRASMSLAVCLFANDYMLERKWVKSLTLYFVGFLFHASTVFIIIMLFFYFLRLNKWGSVIIMGSFLLGFIIQPIVVDYLEMLKISEAIDDKAQRYVNNEEYMESHMNIFGFLSAIIVNLYGVFALWWIKRKSIKNNLLKLEPLVMVFFCLSMLAVGVPIAHRFERFYILYFIMFVAEFVIIQIKKQTCITKGVLAARTIIVMLPFLFLIAKERLTEVNWYRYHPYSSIFDQNTNQKREQIFSAYQGDKAIPGKY